MAFAFISIDRVDWASNEPRYIIRCQHHGDIEKVAGKDAVGRAEDHNHVAHNNRGFVDVPAELSGKRYF